MRKIQKNGAVGGDCRPLLPERPTPPSEPVRSPAQVGKRASVSDQREREVPPKWGTKNRPRLLPLKMRDRKVPAAGGAKSLPLAGGTHFPNISLNDNLLQEADFGRVYVWNF